MLLLSHKNCKDFLITSIARRTSSILHPITIAISAIPNERKIKETSTLLFLAIHVPWEIHRLYPALRDPPTQLPEIRHNLNGSAKKEAARVRLKNIPLIFSPGKKRRHARGLRWTERVSRYEPRSRTFFDFRKAKPRILGRGPNSRSNAGYRGNRNCPQRRIRASFNPPWITISPQKRENGHLDRDTSFRLGRARGLCNIKRTRSLSCLIEAPGLRCLTKGTGLYREGYNLPRVFLGATGRKHTVRQIFETCRDVPPVMPGKPLVFSTLDTADEQGVLRHRLRKLCSNTLLFSVTEIG